MCVIGADLESLFQVGAGAGRGFELGPAAERALCVARRDRTDSTLYWPAVYDLEHGTNIWPTRLNRRR
jgi:hypothetical protein